MYKGIIMKMTMRIFFGCTLCEDEYDMRHCTCNIKKKTMFSIIQQMAKTKRGILFPY